MASFDQLTGPTGARFRLLLFLLNLLLVMPKISMAQTTTGGGLAGVVTDPSNAVVPNADVEIKDNSKGTTHSTKTDQEGVYRFFFLAPTRYALIVSYVRFQTENRAVNVLLGPPVSVNVTLQVAKATNHQSSQRLANLLVRRYLHLVYETETTSEMLLPITHEHKFYKLPILYVTQQKENKTTISARGAHTQAIPL